jgi:hypothetical protein
VTPERRRWRFNGAGVKVRAVRAFRAAQLRVVLTRLSAVDSTNPDDLMASISTSRLSSIYGVGDGTVDALQGQGYLTAADLHDGFTDASELKRVIGIGNKRAEVILNWAEQQWVVCLQRAARSRDRRQRLETERDEHLVALGRESLRHQPLNDEDLEDRAGGFDGDIDTWIQSVWNEGGPEQPDDEE